MFSLLSWLVVGLVVGFIARALVPGRQNIGIPLTIGLGVVGAMLGGLMSSALWPTWADEPDVNRMWPGWLMSVVGAVIVLAGYLTITGQRDVSGRVGHVR